jgi:hypothetical protein
MNCMHAERQTDRQTRQNLQAKSTSLRDGRRAGFNKQENARGSTRQWRRVATFIWFLSALNEKDL